MIKAAYLLLFVSGTALADDAAILKCRTLSDTASRVRCYDAIPVGAPAVAQPAAVKTQEQQFGMEASQRQQVNSIESTIAGDFEGWESGAELKLANGQVWRISDGSAASLPRVSNPKVKIMRGFMGVMYMQVDGLNNSPRVRRVQ
jgi:hypothetical protein